MSFQHFLGLYVHFFVDTAVDLMAESNKVVGTF